RPAPRDPRSPGGGGGGRRRVDRPLPRHARPAGIDAGSPPRPPAPGPTLPALPGGDPQDEGRRARHVLVPAMPAGARPVVTEVAGVRVGHWSDPAAGTGCTVILPPRATVGAVDVRGGGPGTAETDLLSPLAAV